MPPYIQSEPVPPEEFTADGRPGADQFVYCKGCGEPLEGQARRVPRRTVVTVMMCDPCQERHGHALMPKAGSPTYCFRCGTLDETFTSDEYGHPTYHVCPRCLPDRVARYREGNFEVPGETTAWGRRPVRRAEPSKAGAATRDETASK
ncbi:MAG TPA: hypothetical protein VE219_02080 [Candidatus Sulfotelmatobacter sp.]|nr:hypothetical protein [Candidatus Sulfotelmatobacter sp.]